MVRIVIRFAADDDHKAWDDYVLEHPEGLAYQLFAWQQAVGNAYGFEHYSVLAEKDSQICGVFPLIHFVIPLKGERLIALPYCDAGGVLADNIDVARQLIEFAVTRAIKGGAKIDLRSTHELPFSAVNWTDKVRMVLELPGSADELLAGLKSKLRSQVKKPLRDGLTAELGGSELVEEFYNIFSRNMRDLGSPVHSRRWIESIVGAYGDKCRVGLVYTSDGVPAAGGIILLHRKIVSVPWASALREYNRLNPNMLLYWTFLAYAADNGYRSFDFGRSTPAEGTYRFKQQWGAQPKPLYWYRLSANSQKRDSGSKGESESTLDKRQLAVSLWQRMPLWAANIVGPQVRRYISL